MSYTKILILASLLGMLAAVVVPKSLCAQGYCIPARCVPGSCYGDCVCITSGVGLGTCVSID